ncbi:MAG: hypothetical protein ABSG80_08265 [Verrucomicrobiota bacterium]|jgi:hypothetical protein
MKRLLSFLFVSGLMGLQLQAEGILDVNPSIEPNMRAVTGGSQRVVIDTNTPLPQLIERLEGNWRLVETGKGYWIGYTDDMYSIAAHGDPAINPLVKFIKSAQSDKARYGALLSLHLIGIESRITGRFHEKFKNQKVRNVFYELLNDERLRDKVLGLLVRDPWPSDLPHLFEVLGRVPDDKSKPLVNALFRYNLTNSAFGGTLSNGVEGAHVVFVGQDNPAEIGELYVFTRELPDEGFERINNLNHSDTNVIVQSPFPDRGRVVWKFKNTADARKRFAQYSNNRDVHDVVYDALSSEADYVFRFCELDDPFNYHVAGTNVYIISPPVAKTLWLDWWRENSAARTTE